MARDETGATDALGGVSIVQEGHVMNGRTTLLGVLALLSGFAISHAAAGDILPDTVETISPVSARSQGEAVGAPWGLGGAITVPLHTHVDAETYQALKAWAEDDPNAARGDALE